ncbi:MAG TPA: 2-phosphosulfolactate phosphatase [Fervidobacterium sp.]|nr:2-phosphosulfolactate phosphatase [Fervidobacterium sp.]
MSLLNVLFSPDSLLSSKEDEESHFDACVVIDVLRATSTIVTALSNGASEVLPVLNLEDAIEFDKNGYLIGGERGGIKPSGFALGNSPAEYRMDVVMNKRICLTTTNGTKALINARKLANDIYVASFLNLSATVEKLSKYENIAIICAGNDGDVSYEDTQLAGCIVEKLHAIRGYDLSDSALIAFNLWQNLWQRLGRPQFTGSHARKLIKLGFERDVEYCSSIGVNSIVALYDGKVIRKFEG